MAIPHLSAKVISRGKGHSASGAMAYRTGERLQDLQTGRIYDYSGLSDRVAYSTILTPDNAPEWANDRQSLANAIEAKENTHNRRATAQLFREVEVALQREMNINQHIKLVNEFVEENLVSLGMCASISIHTDPDNHNPHAHILLTTREIDEDGFGKKNREWNKKATLQQWRDTWQDKVNDHLEAADSFERIDMRTLQVQGILDRIPDKHYGKHAWNALQNDRETIRGEKLLEREAHYSEVSEFLAASDLQFDDDTAQELMLVRQLRGRELTPDSEPDRLLEKQIHYSRLPQEQERGLEH